MRRYFDKSWWDILEGEFQKPYYLELRKLLVNEYENFEVFPPKEEIFTAFSLTAYDKIKIVILGQDPYHNPSQAQGLAFSVKDGVKIPPSLVNIYKELHDDLGIEPAKTGNLKAWARQGIFLLNTTLTVRKNQPMSHEKIGWEIFTDRVIELIDKKEEALVFILWGGHARSKKRLIKNKKHLIIEGPHPSPLSAYRGFFGSRPFSKANEYLNKCGIEAPRWEIE